jgi:hypothetical protein
MPQSDAATAPPPDHDPARDVADGLYGRGLAVRRAVLGDAHVERSLAAADEYGSL